MMKLLSAIFILMIIPSIAAAAGPPELPDFAGRSDTEIYLSLAVLGFGLVILALQIALMFKVGKGWGPNSIRICGLTLVIISGIFLITAGYSQAQVAPVIGLLGTIAGYLLGKSEKVD